MNTEKISLPRMVILGANGGIGKATVEQALQRGHAVVAVVRNPESLTQRHPNLMVRKADVMMPETLRGLFSAEDVVISAIGKSSTRETTLYSAGDKHILEAMADGGASRLFVSEHHGSGILS